MAIFDASSLKLIRKDLGYPEGPVAMPDGSLLLVEIKNECLTRIHPDGTKETVAEIPGGPNGAAVGPDGKLYVANSGGFYWGPPFEIPLPNGQTISIAALQSPDYQGGSVQRVELDSGAVETVYTDCSLGNDLGGFGKRDAKETTLAQPIPLRGPDDLVFDSSGGMWIADYGKVRPRDKDVTGIFYARADGSSIREMVSGLVCPNGIALSPDADRVYSSLTFSRTVVYWELDGPGHIVPNPETLDGTHLLTADLPGEAILDSISVDEVGNVYVLTMLPKGASPVVNGGVTVVSPDGKQLDYLEIALPGLFAPMPSNICWGGDDRTTAYITCGSSGMLVSVETSVPGLKLAF